MKTMYLPAFLLAAVPALAADAIDADGDGYVSPAELGASYPELPETTFADLDLDGDGGLSAEEVTRAQELGFLPTTSN